MQEQITRNRSLECQHLIKPRRIIALTDDIPANAHIDGKNGKNQFRTCRHPHGKLFTERRTMELHIPTVTFIDFILLDVRTLVILCIHRDTCPEILVEIIHRSKVQTKHSEGTGHQTGFILRSKAFLSRSSIYHQIITDMGLDGKRPDRCSHGWLRSESMHHADSCSEKELLSYLSSANRALR